MKIFFFFTRELGEISKETENFLITVNSHLFDGVPHSDSFY